MQNQNTFDPNQNNTQAGGYNDFYGTNAAGGQPNMQANPTFGADTGAAQGYDPNSFYNQAPAGFPPADPNANPFGQDASATGGFNQPPLYDPNQIPVTATPAADTTFEEPKSGNRFLVIGVVVLIVILIGVAGYIVFAYKDVLFGGQPSTSQTDTKPDTTAKTDTAKTDNTTSGTTSGATTSGTTDTTNNSSCLVAAPTRLVHSDPNETPSQKAKIYNETNVSCDWLKKSFAGKPGSVDQITGQCLKPEVCGLTADGDGDGLTNIQEFNYQTDPLNPDTDSDKVADGDEINVYSTDPKRSDSDGDTFVDSSEAGSCYDPNINDKTLAANDTTQGKLTISRQNEIKNKIVINPLHEPTITTLKATLDPNAVTNGFAKCTPDATAATAGTTSGTASVSSSTSGATTPIPSTTTSSTSTSSGSSNVAPR